MTEKTDPANPVGNPSKAADDPNAPPVAIDALGLSAAEFAAITLRVPNSGTPWIDKMIGEARRMDAAQVAMQALLLKGGMGQSLGDAAVIDNYTSAAIAASDSMARQLSKTGK